MPRSTAEHPLCRLALSLLALQVAAPATAQLSTLSGPSRLVNVIEVSSREDQVDVTMVFNCSMRFVTNMPVSEGREVNIQLVPLADCRVSPLGQIPSEIPPLSGGGDIVTGARVESVAPGQITLTLKFRNSERFVIAQGVDPQGLRLRLVDRSRGRGKIVVGENEAVSTYAINLDSQSKPFTPEEIQRAHDRLKAPAFVSELVINGERWYRLRVGPIERRSEADRLLNLALPEYPRAWLAIGDDTATSETGAPSGGLPLPPVEKIGADPALPADEQKKILADARTALAAHDYSKAIALLTKLQRQPEFPDRARAQELLGLAYERSGQLAHAKAEYQEYLHRYPNGEAAERVSFRLRTLQAAEAKTRTGREVSAPAEAWDFLGGVSQMFRYDGTRVTNSAPPLATTLPLSAQTNSDNALFTDLDFLARRRGETFDIIGRFNGGYDKSFSQGGPSGSDATRVSIATIEALDRQLGLLARVGRQTTTTYGLLGTFDGLYLSWQFKPSWSLVGAAGYPVNLLTISPQTNVRFEAVALAYTPPGARWDGAVFAAEQQNDGFTDRRAVGAEGRYIAPRGSLVAVIDYDTEYHSLNTASLIGTLQLPARWTTSFDAEKRNSPVLTTGNALIGQPVTSLKDLLQFFTPEQIRQLAIDRTADSTNYSVTATKPLGAQWQFTGTVTALSISATPASGGVPAQDATGTLMNYQAQLYANDLWTAGDFDVLTLTYGKTEVGPLESLNIVSRFPIGGAWRLAPRFGVQHLTQNLNNSTQTTYLPSFLLDWQQGNKLVQLEVGSELGSRQATLQLATGQFVQTQNSTRYYVALSYRLTFGR